MNVEHVCMEFWSAVIPVQMYRTRTEHSHKWNEVCAVHYILQQLYLDWLRNEFLTFTHSTSRTVSRL